MSEKAILLRAMDLAKTLRSKSVSGITYEQRIVQLYLAKQLGVEEAQITLEVILKFAHGSGERGVQRVDGIGPAGAAKLMKAYKQFTAEEAESSE